MGSGGHRTSSNHTSKDRKGPPSGTQETPKIKDRLSKGTLGRTLEEELKGAQGIGLAEQGMCMA